MKKTTLFLLLFCLGFACQATAQHKTVVYGDLGVSSVNISIVDTQHGTSTDAEGHYELSLPDRLKTVDLYYSCIGYQDTVVSLTTRQLQRDSINISFKMRPLNYALQEVTVTENASKLAYENKTVWVMDYKVQDDGIYIVAGNSNESVLLHLSFEQDTISLKPISSKYQELYRDAFGNLHLIGSDSTYQIFCDGKQLHLLYGSKKDIFRQKMKPIVAATDSIIVLEMWRSYGQEVVFVAVNINNGQRFLLQNIGGETTEMANFWALDNKRKSKMDKLAEEDSEFIDIEKETNIEIRNLKEIVKKRVMLHPVYCPLFGIGNKLYLFAFPENALIVFDQNGKEENKMEMDFHKQLGIGLSKHLTFNNPWNKDLVFDRARMMMYAQYKTDGLITLKEIDLRDGKTKREIQLRDHVFPQNIQVYNGEVYYLFLDNQQKRERDKRSLYKTKLD
jgi:hypothetical protein